MACSDWSDYATAASEGAFRDALLCPWADEFGAALFMLGFLGVISMGLYIKTDDIVIPWSVMMFGSAILLPFVSSLLYTAMVVVTLFIGGAIPVYFLNNRQRR